MNLSIKNFLKSRKTFN